MKKSSTIHLYKKRYIREILPTINCAIAVCYLVHQHSFFFRKESDSGEEGISIEELKKTTGWELLMKNLNKHFKPKDFDSQ